MRRLAAIARSISPSISPSVSPSISISPSVLLAVALGAAASSGSLGCGPSRAPAPAAVEAPLQGQLPDGRTVRVIRSKSGALELTPLLATDPANAAATSSGGGLPYLWPPMIDSHVHLAYWAVADQLAARGVLAAVDLSAPLGQLAALRAAPIEVRYSGPMLTRPGGYPLDSWGKDGYGLACDAIPCVESTVAELAKGGASVIKIALAKNGLAAELVAPAVTAAHRAGLRVAVHALTDADAKLAAQAGGDLLAHTPVEPLAPDTVEAWRGRAVISTLAAFGGGAAAVENLRRLRAAGVTVLYGTDLGNQRDAGPSDEEISLLRAAGLDDAALVEAMTAAPARYWQLGDALAGPSPAPAALLVLAGDPRRDLRFLLAPRQILRAAVQGSGGAGAPTGEPR